MCDVGYKCLLSGKGGVEYVDRGQAGKDGQGKGNREGRGMWTGGRGVDGWTGGGVGGEYLKAE